MAGHVVLVGLMGSGNSTIGKRLASRLDRPFVDADEAVEEAAGRSIAELFAGGEATFRALEAETLAALLDRPDPVVIAAGGGAVVTDATRARLRDPSVTVVWLDGSPAFLASRTKRKPHRPLLAEGDARETLTRLHRERADLYREVADIVVDVEPFHRSDESPKQALAAEVARLVAEREQTVAGAAP